MSTSHHNGTSPRRVMTKGVREFAHDAVTLGELQCELAKLDVQQWTQRLVAPLLLFAIALAIGLGGMPVLLHGLAFALVEAAGWPHWLSFLLAGVLGVITAAILGYIGWLRLRASFEVFERTRAELRQNVDWLKHVLNERCATDDGAPAGSSRFSPMRGQEVTT